MESVLLKAQVRLGRWAAWSNTCQETLEKHPNGSVPQFLSQGHEVLQPGLTEIRHTSLQRASPPPARRTRGRVSTDGVLHPQGTLGNSVFSPWLPEFSEQDTKSLPTHRPDLQGGDTPCPRAPNAMEKHRAVSGHTRQWQSWDWGRGRRGASPGSTLQVF